jgi:hypothetical protein
MSATKQRFRPLSRSQKMINPFREAPKVNAPHARDKATIQRLAMYQVCFNREIAMRLLWYRVWQQG